MLDAAGRAWRRLVFLMQWRRRNSEIAEEIALHEEMHRSAFERGGMTPGEARIAAAQAMGHNMRMREDARGIWLVPWLESVWQDATYGMRSLRRQPMFTFAAVLALAGGIGFGSALFTSFNALILREWAVREPDRMIAIFDPYCCDRAGGQPNGFSLDEVRFFREHSTTLDGIILSRQSGQDPSDELSATRVSANYFEVLGVPMERGRAFAPDEDRAESPQGVMVLSWRYWQQRLTGDPNVVGTTVKLRGMPFTVVGVASRTFAGTEVDRADAWIPLAAMQLTHPKDSWVQSVLLHPEKCCTMVAARLAPGASATMAEAELAMLRSRFAPPGTDAARRRIQLGTFTAVGAAPPQKTAGQIIPLFVLMGAGVTLVLMLACANVANLLLARSMARQREITLRLSLGASRWRVVRQLMTESLVLAMISGSLALAIAYWFPSWIMSLTVPTGFAIDLTPDHRVLLFTVALSVLSCVLFGLAPALHVTRPVGLRGGRLSLRSVFLSAQVTFCVLLLVTAGLFLRSVDVGRTADIGFPSAQLTEVRISIPANVDDSVRSLKFKSELPELLAQSGIRHVGYTGTQPFSLGRVSYRVTGSDERRYSRYATVSPFFFEAVGRRMIVGREFADNDLRDGNVIVNETLAKRFGGPLTAIGATMLVDSMPRTIVGVVSDARDADLRQVEDVMYRPLSWSSIPRVVVRADAPNVRKLVLAITERDPSTRVIIRTYDEYVEETLRSANTAAAMAGALGALALVLATVGMFGVFSYWVHQRRHDIGVRMALGASRTNVIRLVLGASTRAVGWGLLLGVLGAVAASRVLRSSLYGLSPLDPSAFGGAIAVLVVAAILATVVPVWRAVRVDPIESLRAD